MQRKLAIPSWIPTLIVAAALYLVVAWAKSGGNGALAKNKTSYSVAGEVGARASKLYKMLDKRHNDVKLKADEFRRITLWIDCNSNFYGAYRDIEKQAAGASVKPILE